MRRRRIPTPPRRWSSQPRSRVIPLHQGDAVDFWRVQEATENRLLLRAEMKLPGRAWLQFQLASLANGSTRVRSVASFEPRGLTGRLYWWALYPLHRLIFAGMLRGIRQAAEKRVGFPIRPLYATAGR